MKNLQTNLLGRSVNLTGDTTNRLYSVVAIWLADGDKTPSVAIEQVNTFGRPIGGPIVTAHLTDLFIA